MKRTIWKYTLPLDDNVTKVKLPSTHKIIHVGLQSGYPTLWVEVPVFEEDNKGSREAWSKSSDQVFRVVGTGMEVPESPAASAYKFVHIGTCQDSDFGLVWHVYQERER